MTDKKSGFADVLGAKLYYELAGEGQPFVMIHAGVADSRQWEGEFEHFADRYQVMRFDMRGYGKSLPVEGDFNILDDLVALLDALNITQPIILMGCSIGGGLGFAFALAYPERIKALIVVASAPGGLAIENTNEPEELFEQAEAAFEAGNLDLAAEIETQIWFDGLHRTSDTINQEIRKLAYEMDRLALEHAYKKIGKHVSKGGTPVFERLNEIQVPMLDIIGLNDSNYAALAADYMQDHVKTMKRIDIANAAHLPNMEQPEIFQIAIDEFLAEHSL